MKHFKYFGDSDLRYNTFDEIVEHLPSEIKQMLLDLKTLRERPDHHPEPNTFEHIKIVVNRLLQTKDPDLVLTGIFHDICKLTTNRGHPKTGWPSAPDHPDCAAEMVDTHRDWIWWFGANPDNVKWLCQHHMAIKQITTMRRNNSKKIEMKQSPLWDKLITFSKADDMNNEFKI